MEMRAGEEMIAALSCSMAQSCSSCQMKSVSFRVRSTRGLAIEEKSLIQMRMVPAVPRNAQTSETVLHGSQVRTFATLESSGMWPSYVHLWLSTITSGTARKIFFAETVAPACPSQCRTRWTLLRCSRMKRRMPGLSGVVSYPPSGVS